MAKKKQRILRKSSRKKWHIKNITLTVSVSPIKSFTLSERNALIREVSKMLDKNQLKDALLLFVNYENENHKNHPRAEQRKSFTFSRTFMRTMCFTSLVSMLYLCERTNVRMNIFNHAITGISCQCQAQK